jgi:hypothetical protein
MRVIIGRAAIVALAMAGCVSCSDKATSTAQAAGGEAQGEFITAVGCPIAPKPGCVTIAADGKTYDISSAGVDMSKGVGVSLTGRAAGEATACGSKLSEVKVDYLSLQCGPPKPAG